MGQEEWDKLVERSPQGTIFSSTKWLKLFNKPYILYGAYQGTQLVGGAGGFLEPTPLTPFQGILTLPAEGMTYTSVMSLHNQIAEAVLDARLLEYVPCHYTYPDVRPFLWRGWQPSVKYTYVVDTSDYGKTLARMEKDTRYEITKAARMVNVGDSINIDTMQRFDRLYGLTFERKGLMRPVDSAFMQRFWQGIRPIVFLSSDSKAGAVLMADSKRGYYIFGASDGDNPPSSLTVNVMLEYASKQGIQEVDMVGCNDKKIGVFKRGFAGQLNSYFTVKV